jgi:hypothetical protein
MKPEELLERIGEIKDDYIAEAAPESKSRRSSPFARWGTLAACLALSIFILNRIMPPKSIDPSPGTDNLPMLTITEGMNEGMGFEGYSAFDISEIVSDNPWSPSSSISTLPVYKNPLRYDKYSQVIGTDPEKMKGLLMSVAERLGMDADSTEITNYVADEYARAAIIEKYKKAGSPVPEDYFNPSSVILDKNGIRIEVDQQLTAKITFSPEIGLPDAYSFTHFATYEKKAEAAEYLKAEFKDLIGMDNAQINVYGGDYAVFSGEDIEVYGKDHAQHYYIEFYEGTGEIVSEIINFNFNRVAFYPDDEGKLFLARVFQPDLSLLAGNYPIITAEEAKELLNEGHYLTTVPEKKPGLEYVAKVELIYRAYGTEQYYIPYYRFYVELPDMERENGLKTYVAYYVPAVEGKYITNMPIWDGSFN